MPKSFTGDDDELGKKIDRTKREIFTCIGGDVVSDGKLACSFKIGSATFDADCAVMSDDKYVVIGLDFLCRHKCVIDCARNRITLNGNLHVGVVPDGKIKNWVSSRKCYERKYCPPPSFEIDDEKLKELIAMKFTEDEAIKALTGTLNDLDLAVSDLYYMEHDREMMAQIRTSK